MQTERNTNVINVLTPHVRDCHVTQQRGINFVSSRVTFDGTHVVYEAVLPQATLNYFLAVSFFLPYADDLTTHDSSISGRSRCRDITYHLAENDYSFDALQAYCFGINIKL